MAAITWPTVGNAFTETKRHIVSSEGRSPPRKVIKLGHPATARSPKHDGIYTIKPITPLDPLLSSAQSALEQLKHSIREMLDTKNYPNDPIPTKSYEAIYDLCRTSMLANYQSQLQDAIQASLTQCARLLLRNIQSDTSSPLQWLQRIVIAWDWWLRRLMLLRGVLSWLDNNANKHDKFQTWKMGLEVFKDTIMKTGTVEHTGTSALALWLDEEHSTGPITSRDTISQYTQILSQLDLVSSHLEEPYFTWIENYYSEQSLISYSSPIALLLDSLQHIQTEELLASTILGDASVKTVIFKTLIKHTYPHVDTLVTKGLELIVDDKNFDNLIQMYHLMGHLDEASLAEQGSEPALPSKRLLESFKRDASRRVKLIVTNMEADAQMVERLIELRDFYETFLKTHISEKDDPDRRWLHSLNEAFENGIAARKRKPAEMIAKSLDFALRRGQKDSSDEHFMGALKKMLNLSRFTSDKDVFKAFYARGLSKRLLLGKSASDDFEKAVIGLLTREYDVSFEDMNGMFSDMSKSRDMTTAYREQSKKTDAFDPKLSVIVVQQSVWPIVLNQDKNDSTQMLRLPYQLQQSLEDFKAFYKTQHQAHKLMWSHPHGTVTLTAKFPLGAKELSVSLYQATVLLCFNEENERSYEDIQLLVGLGDAELIPTLQSLSVGKKEVLIKSSKGKSVKKDDRFTVNAEFTDPKWKIHINSIQQQETAEETQQAERSIDHNRDGALDAAIVRIMKSSKIMKHGELVQATVEAVKKHFVPDIPAIKLRIESLAKRDFIERKDTVTWTYIA